jgi:poly(A) polymerase
MEHNRPVQPRELANSICSTLQQRGFQALLAGGCVRDILLQRKPVDYDVATDATPDQVLEIFPESIAVGAQFGVVLVPRHGLKVEVATFRHDVSYTDGRHPDQITFARTPEEDVSRRDFTINGLLMRHNTSEILDFVGGQADLAAALIRAIGDPTRRFTEDKLRMLRGIRFAARFSFQIEPMTFAAIQKQAKEIHVVSAERIREELTKILIEGHARGGFELLDESGLLLELLPEVSRMKGVPQPPEYHPEGDVWTHTLLLLQGLPAGCSTTLAWGVLLHDVGKPPTFQSPASTGDRIRFNGHAELGTTIAKEICRRLRFSNDDTEQILSLVANHMKFKDVSQMKQSTLKKFVRLPYFQEHLELHRLDCGASHGNLDAYNAVRAFIASTPPEQVRPPRLLNGHDLCEMGYTPGPQFQKMLATLEDAQLEGALNTREQAETFVLDHFPLSTTSR